MRKFLILALFLPLSHSALPQNSSPSTAAKTVAFTRGHWFDGHTFRNKTIYAVNGIFSPRRPAHIDSVLDLGGGYVVPPFGEAHNHNVEAMNHVDTLIQRYLEHGIFYVKNPDNLPNGRDQVLAKINRPGSIDVTFANGGFTSPDGHPADIVKRNIDRGLWTEREGEGAFYYPVSSAADVERWWPQFLATKPDFVKTYLLFSNEYAARKDDSKYFGWRGLDPTLLKDIVDRAHEAGLRVSTHVENAADFHNALVAGVDEINHTPGFRVTADVKPHALSEFQIAESDARLAARNGVYVVTTLAAAPAPIPAQKFDERDELNRRNLALLKRYHVKLALGSDSYRSDTVPEALYLAFLRVFSNAELLSIWCDSTAHTIFPRRKIGKLQAGYEASFIVLKKNPLEDFSSVTNIAMAFKQGQVLSINSGMPAHSQ